MFSMFKDIFKDRKKTLMFVLLAILLLFSMTKKSKPSRVEVRVQQPVIQQPVIQQPVIQQPVVRQEQVIQQPVRQEQVVQKQVVQEQVLQEQPVRQEQVVQEQVVQEQPLQEQPIQQEQVVENFNNKTKTKATLYWASWCGHCQMTKPKWMEMKEHFSKKKGIEIEEINCEGDNYKKCIVLNDQGKPDHVRGYPTMVVRKLNKDNLIVKEVEYSPNQKGNIKGDRSVKDLINFVNYYNKSL